MIQHPARGPRKEDALPKELSAGLGDEAPLDGDARSRGNFSEGRVQQTAGGIAAGGPATSAPRGRTAIPPGTITSRPFRRKRRRGLPGGPIKKAGAPQKKVCCGRPLAAPHDTGRFENAPPLPPETGDFRDRDSSGRRVRRRRLMGLSEGPPHPRGTRPDRPAPVPCDGGSSAPARDTRSPIPCASLKQAHPHRRDTPRPPVRPSGAVWVPPYPRGTRPCVIGDVVFSDGSSAPARRARK